MKNKEFAYTTPRYVNRLIIRALSIPQLFAYITSYTSRMNFNRITNPVSDNSFNISTLVGQQQKDHGQRADANINKNQSKNSIEKSTPVLTSDEACASQHPGKENVDVGPSDKEVRSSGRGANEKPSVTQQSSIKTNKTQGDLLSQRPKDVAMQPSELVKACNNVCTNYAQEMSQIRDWCETALQEIHNSKETLEETKMELALLLCGCFESFDPNTYSEVEKMHAELRLLVETTPYLME